MKVLFYALPLLIITSCQGQSAKIKTKPAATTAEAKTSDAATITEIKAKDSTFPVINLADKAKADRINTYLINSVLGDEFKLPTIKAQLTKERGISSLSYKVIINTSMVLTISISLCRPDDGRGGCGGGQYNFDLTTGYNFGLDQIIKPSSTHEIKKLVCNDAKKRMVDAKAKAKKELGNGWYEKDMLDLTYEGQWQDEYKKLQYCDIELGTGFKLSNDGISFFYTQMFFLPMSIHELMPDDEYFYPWNTLKPFLISSSSISSFVK